MARKNRRRPTKRFFITVAVLACVILLTVFLILQGPKEALITEGNLFVDRDVETLIVRDEKVYNSDNYSRLPSLPQRGRPLQRAQRLPRYINGAITKN